MIASKWRRGIGRPGGAASGTCYLLKDSPLEQVIRAVRAPARGESMLSPWVAGRLTGQARGPARDALSRREREVLALIASGATNREAAASLLSARPPSRPP